MFATEIVPLLHQHVADEAGMQAMLTQATQTPQPTNGAGNGQAQGAA
jgi:hypothetical protein